MLIRKVLAGIGFAIILCGVATDQPRLTFAGTVVQMFAIFVQI